MFSSKMLRYLLAATLSLAPLPIVDAQSAGWLPLARAGGGGTPALVLTDTGKAIGGCFIGCTTTLATGTASAGRVTAVGISVSGVNAAFTYTVTLDSNAMSCFDSTINQTQTAIICWIANPTGTSSTLAFNMTGASPNASGVYAAAYALTNITTTPTAHTGATKNNNADPQNIGITIPSTGFVIEAVSYDRLATPTWGNTNCPTNCVNISDANGALFMGNNTTAGSQTLAFSAVSTAANAEIAVAWGP